MKIRIRNPASYRKVYSPPVPLIAAPPRHKQLTVTHRSQWTSILHLGVCYDVAAQYEAKANHVWTTSIRITAPYRKHLNPVL